MEPDEFDSTYWDGVVELLGGEAALAASAFTHKALLRRRAVESAGSLLRLIFIYGPGGHALRTVSGLASTGGIAELSDVALLKRIAGSAEWLKALCERQLAAAAPASGAGLRLRIVDSTTIAAPGSSGSYRLHLSYDPLRQRIGDVELTAISEGERLDRLPLKPGDLVLGDRGYPKPDGLANLIKSGAHVLVRVTWKSLHLIDEAGKPINWNGLFAAAEKHGFVDKPIRVARPRGRFEPLPLRLVILPKPAEAAASSRAKAKHANRKDQHGSCDPRTLAAADHLILLTSLSEDQIAAPALKDLYAVRWQIELAFKRMKSILNLARLPAKNPNLARAWLHAHLLFALLIDAIAAPQGDFPP